MKISQQQLNEEVNQTLIPYLMEADISINQIVKLVHLYATERLNDYEWQENDRVMEIIKEEVNKFLNPSFEDRFGPICLN